jgi:hypothetical protein
MTARANRKSMICLDLATKNGALRSSKSKYSWQWANRKAISVNKSARECTPVRRSSGIGRFVIGRGNFPVRRHFDSTTLNLRCSTGATQGILAEGRSVGADFHFER